MSEGKKFIVSIIYSMAEDANEFVLLLLVLVMMQCVQVDQLVLKDRSRC